MPQPLDRVIHTMGWPLRNDARYREFGGSFIYPLGDDMVSHRDGRRPRLPRRRALGARPAAGAEDASARPAILEGGERIEWGAKTIPEGGFVALPRALHAPGLLLCGDGAGLVNVPALKGVHYAVESGRLAAEAAFAAVRRGASPATALGSYDDALRESFIWSDLREVRNMRQAFGHGFWLGGALAGAMTVTKGRFPPGNAETERDAEQALISTAVAPSYPGARRQADVRQALVRLRVRQQDARRPAEPHPRADERALRGRPHVGAACARRRSTSDVDGEGAGDAVELRPVRRDHREGRPPDPAGGRLGPGVQALVKHV